MICISLVTLMKILKIVIKRSMKIKIKVWDMQHLDIATLRGLNKGS